MFTSVRASFGFFPRGCSGTGPVRLELFLKPGIRCSLLSFLEFELLWAGSGFACFADLIVDCSDTAEGGILLSVSGTSRLVLSFLKIWPRFQRGLLVLGDLWDVGSLDISLNELGVGLDGRFTSVVLDPKAELMLDG